MRRRHFRVPGFLKWLLSTLWMNQIYKHASKDNSMHWSILYKRYLFLYMDAWSIFGQSTKWIQNWPCIQTHLLHLTTPPVDPPFLERPRSIIQPTTFRARRCAMPSGPNKPASCCKVMRSTWTHRPLMVLVKLARDRKHDLGPQIWGI